MSNQVQNYYPEMNEAKPVAQIEIKPSHGSKTVFDTPIALAPQVGLTLLQTYVPSDLVSQAQHKVGWNRYEATARCFTKLQAQYTMSRACLLD